MLVERIEHGRDLIAAPPVLQVHSGRHELDLWRRELELGTAQRLGAHAFARLPVAVGAVGLSGDGGNEGGGRRTRVGTRDALRFLSPQHASEGSSRLGPLTREGALACARGDRSRAAVVAVRTTRARVLIGRARVLRFSRHLCGRSYHSTRRGSVHSVLGPLLSASAIESRDEHAKVDTRGTYQIAVESRDVPLPQPPLLTHAQRVPREKLLVVNVAAAVDVRERG
eukprot:1451757-Pleurochrysis_carterae.AAC.1